MITAAAPGHSIGGGIGATQTGRSWITFYVESPDLAKTLARVEQLGGRTVAPPMDMGPVQFALFSDPEGNVIGLAKSDEERARPTARRAAARSSTRKTTARKRTTAKRTAKRPTRRSRGR